MAESLASLAPEAGPSAEVGPSKRSGTAAIPRPTRWTYLLVGAALAWAVLLRVPLVLNARIHLDSDLAVDGLTLREAVAGHWRWHYPGTPHMGILPVLLSWPQAMIWGANPTSLVSGGTVAHAALVVATFVLAWRAFGPAVAAWSLVPLTFASTGTIWLSGRITGGHLLAAVWHASAFALLHACLSRGGWRPAALLGAWCGLGIYVDSMFVMTLAGLVPAAVAGWWAWGRPRSGLVAALAFVPAFLLGVAPREIGARVDAYDAYPGQFTASFQHELLLRHLQILGLNCLPRLITGHRLPDLHSEPSPMDVGVTDILLAERDATPLPVALTVVVFVLFLSALRALFDPLSTRGDPAAAAVRRGLLLSSATILVAFVINRNIFNSDNYRYLVDLLVPWSIGFGLAMHGMTRVGRVGWTVAGVCALAVASLMTLDAGRWYSRFGWIDRVGRPVRPARFEPLVGWLDEHAEVTHFMAGYWDVYRLCFLAHRPVRGIPFPIFPNRFPEWADDLSGPHPHYVVLRRTFENRGYTRQLRDEGGDVILIEDGLFVYSWP